METINPTFEELKRNFNSNQKEFEDGVKTIQDEIKNRNVKYGIVHFEYASLLRKIGYDKPVNYVYYRNKRRKLGWDIDSPEPIVSHNANEYPYSSDQMSAPSITEVNSWLLANYGVKILLSAKTHYKRVDGELRRFIDYNKAGTDLKYDFCVYVLPVAYKLNKDRADYLLSYVDAHVGGKYDETELGTFEFALSIVCNGIIEYNKSVK